jgi:hypothetical protein
MEDIQFYRRLSNYHKSRKENILTADASSDIQLSIGMILTSNVISDTSYILIKNEHRDIGEVWLIEVLSNGSRRFSYYDTTDSIKKMISSSTWKAV